MEIEASAASVAAKKLWNVVRIMLIMMRKGVSKSKIMVELHTLLKRGKLAGKAMAESFILHSSAASAFSCRSSDALSFVSPRDYEFSCSNSPAAAFAFRRHHHKHNHRRGRFAADDEDVDVPGATLSAVQKMLEMYAAGAAAEASPAMVFGRSPAVPVRQLRITDSPFPLKDEGDSLVDVKAEDFIKKFYKSLKQQKRMAYLESPYREVYG